MNKLKLILVSILSISLFQMGLFSTTIIAATNTANDPLNKACSLPNAANSDACKYRTDAKRDNILGPTGIVTRVIQTLVFVVAAITVIAVIIGGLKYVLSGGDPAGINSAKDTILYALVGLVLALFAQVIVSFVLSKL